MAEQTRKFHLGDILTITTGRLVAPGRIAAVHEFLDYMTGDTLMTHQLPRACDECAPELLRQHPHLADVPVPESFDDEAGVIAWLSEQVAAHGEYLDVAPLRSEDHTRINPVAELAMIAPHMQAIPVVVDDGRHNIGDGGEGGEAR